MSFGVLPLESPSDTQLASDLVIIRSIFKEPLLLYFRDVAYECLVPRLEDLVENYVFRFTILRASS